MQMLSKAEPDLQKAIKREQRRKSGKTEIKVMMKRTKVPLGSVPGAVSISEF